MKVTFLYNGQPLEIVAQRRDALWQITLPNGITRSIVIRQGAAGCAAFEQAPKSGEDEESTVYTLPIAKTTRGIEVSHEGRTYVFEEPRRIAAKRKSGGGRSGSLVAPMVGVVADVLVSDGDLVAAYQPLVIVEAMKVMATIEAPFAGQVARVYVTKGAQLAHGEPVIDIVEASASPSGRA